MLCPEMEHAIVLSHEAQRTPLHETSNFSVLLIAQASKCGNWIEDMVFGAFWHRADAVFLDATRVDCARQTKMLCADVILKIDF